MVALHSVVLVVLKDTRGVSGSTMTLCSKVTQQGSLWRRGALYAIFVFWPNSERVLLAKLPNCRQLNNNVYRTQHRSTAILLRFVIATKTVDIAIANSGCRMLQIPLLVQRAKNADACPHLISFFKAFTIVPKRK